MLSRRTFGQGLAGAGLVAASGAAAQVAAGQVVAPWYEEGLVERGGGVIHWVAMGKGPPVVLMPKLGGRVADWRHVAPLLADRFRLIVIDPPGHGQSRMATPPPFAQTLPESAAMIRAALQELGIGRFMLVGNSLGGCIGLIMAALWPKDVTRLVVLSSVMGPGVTRAELERSEASTSADFAADGRPLPRAFETMDRMFGLTPEIHEEMNASRAQAGAWARASQRGVAMADIPAYLPRIEAPTLLIYGTKGPYPANREIGLSLIPRASAMTIEGGSFLHQEKPVEVAGVIRRFLESAAP